MRSVHFSCQGVHRPVSIDTLDSLDAFDLTRVDVLDAKLDGNWTQEWMQRIGQESCFTNGQDLRLFPEDSVRQGVQGVPEIDHRIMYSTVARKPVFRNAIYAAATALLPLRWPIPKSSAAVQWAT